LKALKPSRFLKALVVLLAVSARIAPLDDFACDPFEIGRNNEFLRLNADLAAGRIDLLAERGERELQADDIQIGWSCRDGWTAFRRSSPAGEKRRTAQHRQGRSCC
jgi:hypothetical protein